ncbi:LuxR C-terminal-related transcriptional regulator [Paraflavitalea sp. CAU 1676]|uniref:helix-turn-helix transcriptional regulator n=1 Tax=Paraflavitalea sp. CAU 1676 TaxID=3032598 RepID=UPI0023DBF63A|nr:LuxR C-terminal-related transcriptional regulator [Paraflavitalea sp. CAU 1676]MDF2190518.1 LuxR C-terminal-related transcriptional regulator [Paraflavitalea sp. CAU 1676]
MLVFGTQMHIVTFVLICVEVAVLLSLITHGLIRPDDRNTLLNSILVLILICYNITGGLLPDPKLDGSVFLQNCIAYGTGFLGPTYFPFYVYSAFGLEKMKFHIITGVSLFLLIPYILFIILYAYYGQIRTAQYVLVVPVFYAIWVITSVVKSIKHKYGGQSNSSSIVETTILILSLSPWVFLPVIDFVGAGQAIEVISMNSGFLLLFIFQLKQNIETLRKEHKKAISIPEQQTTDTTNIHPRSLNGSLKNYNLTKRELEIVTLIANGYTYKRIATELYISDKTVKKHSEHIFAKMNVNNKFELLIKINSSQQEQSE